MIPVNVPILPTELEAVFKTFKDDPPALIEAFMPIFCDFVKADRIFIAPRNPYSRVCTMMKWRRHENIPWPAIPGVKLESDKWIVEDKWEIEDPLFRAALNLQPSIYVEYLEKAAAEGILNLDFETSYMFHTAFIHGHAHWPPLQVGNINMTADKERQFYGSVQPAVFDGPKVWSEEIHDLVEKCLVRIAPVMKAHAETAPDLADLEI